MEDGLDLNDVGVAVAVDDARLLQARLQLSRLPDRVLLDRIVIVADPDWFEVSPKTITVRVSDGQGFSEDKPFIIHGPRRRATPSVPAPQGEAP